MRYIATFLVFLLLSAPSFSQDYTSNWEGLFSYYNITDLSSSNNLIFASAKNSVFSYNLSSGEIKTFSTVNGLAGEDISAVHFSAATNLLIIGFETGLINVYNYNTGESLQVIDITEKQTVAPNKRRINNFYENENQLYISTNYGISVYNLSNLEFGDTFFIGDAGSQLEVRQLLIFNDIIYAATQGGSVRYASINNPNLIDFNQWQQTPGNFINIKEIVEFNNKVYTVSNSNAITQIQNNSLNFVSQFNGNVVDLSVGDDKLIVAFQNKIEAYSTQFGELFLFNSFEFSPNFSSVLLVNNQLFIGDQSEGLLNVSINSPNVVNYLSPPGPLRNSVFQMQAIPNELWTVYGDYDVFFNPYNPVLKSFGASHLENDEWINIPFEEINANNLVNIAINPRDVDEVFISSFNDGLVEIQDNEVVNLYNQSNSPIEEMIDDEDNAIVPDDTRVNGIAFDRNGTLWGNVARVVNGLFSLSPSSGNFNVYDISEVIPNDSYYKNNFGFTDIVIENSGNLYFGSYTSGVIAFQPSTNTFARLLGNEGQGNLPDNYVTKVALDNNNQLWIGTLRGLRVLFNPSSIFNNQNTEAQEIIILDSDGVAQELFANISISDIEVDGNNNKWIATDSGAFYISSNGQETIYNFTTSNSPLPTNTITDIEVDGSTGVVYIGTTKGIVAFRGTATNSQETFDNVRAFPNPVRPNYSGMVTIDGLIENANVKITDIEGNLVYEKVSEGGSIQWDTRAFGKHKVASGVYMVLITSSDQLQTKVAKIMVIR